MPRGYEDWGVAPNALAFHQVDIGELSVRLGYPERYVRSGKTIFIDTFEDLSLAYERNHIANNQRYVISTERSVTGISSLKVVPGNGGSGEGQITRYLAGVVSGKYGITCMVYPHVDMDVIVVHLYRYTGTQLLRGNIQINWFNGNLFISQTAGNTVIGSTPAGILNSINVFSLIKLVIDINNQRYDYVRINDTVFDLSQYSLAVINSTTVPSLGFSFYCADFDLSQNPLYVDNVVLTYDEP
jgi:hypothetical protein